MNKPLELNPPSSEDQFITMDGKRLPAPTRVNCPDHQTWPTVWKDGKPFCRFGRHYPWDDLPNS